MPLKTLLDEALKFLMEAPEDEVNRLLAESGEDPADVDRRSKAAFDAAFKQYGQHKRDALKRGRLRSLSGYRQSQRNCLLHEMSSWPWHTA